VHRRRPPPRHRDEFRAHFVVVAVGPDAQVKPFLQPYRGELDLGHRPDVPGEHRLVRAPVQPAEHLRGAGQRAPADGDYLSHRGRLRGQARDERVDVPPRLIHPRHSQSLQDDRPVGAPGHWRERLDRPTEELHEHYVVQVPAYTVGVKQCAVDVPEHQLIAHRSSFYPPAVPAEGGHRITDFPRPKHPLIATGSRTRAEPSRIARLRSYTRRHARSHSSGRHRRSP
jgi:hypothetical protein